MKVAIFGASNNPDRYSAMAMNLLIKKGHEVFLINPRLTEIDGKKCYKDILELKKSGILIETLTMYINPQILAKEIDKIFELNPKRIIFNPGTESPAFYEILKKNNIEVLEACTLVMLNTNQF